MSVAAPENGDLALTAHRPFDLLIVDEAHHVALTAPQQAFVITSRIGKVTGLAHSEPPFGAAGDFSG